MYYLYKYHNNQIGRAFFHIFRNGLVAERKIAQPYFFAGEFNCLKSISDYYGCNLELGRWRPSNDADVKGPAVSLYNARCQKVAFSRFGYDASGHLINYERF